MVTMIKTKLLKGKTMKINYGTCVCNCEQWAWLTRQLGDRLDRLIWAASSDIGYEKPWDFMQRRHQRVQKFLPQGWRIEYTDDRQTLLILDDYAVNQCKMPETDILAKIRQLQTQSQVRDFLEKQGLK
jgi:hypothetical protein